MNSPRLVVYTEQGGIAVSGAEGESLEVYGISGAMVSSIPSATEEMVIPVPQAGVYMVKCGSSTTKVVVK